MSLFSANDGSFKSQTGRRGRERETAPISCTPQQLGRRRRSREWRSDSAIKSAADELPTPTTNLLYDWFFLSLERVRERDYSFPLALSCLPIALLVMLRSLN